MSISSFKKGDALMQRLCKNNAFAVRVVNFLVTRRYMLLPLLLVYLLLPTGFSGDGNVVKLNDRLYLLQVQMGYSNRVSDYFGERGFSLASNKDNTVWTSIMNGYGNAVEVYTGEAPQGLLLSVDESRDGYANGFRDLDVVTDVSVNSNCAERYSALRLNWRSIFKCDSLVTISRDTGEVTLNVPKGGDQGVSTIIIRSDRFFNIPNSMRSSQGTSGGLAFSLDHLEALGRGSLFSNDIVAATGSIYPSNGSIGKIEGLTAKAEAAYKAGATILFVPKGQSKDVAKYPGLTVYEVGSLLDATKILCDRGSDDEVCQVIKKRR
ncbi:MAG: hypothetical protein ACKOW9_00140 [Candidatus Paceibacterota bacterium]